MRYEAALNIRFLEAGIYTAGANVYTKENGSKELIKVASLYLNAESKRKAALAAIETILNELEDGSGVTIRGRQLGTRMLRKIAYDFRDILEKKQLYLFVYNSELAEELEELYELAQHAADRQSSLISEI